MAACYSPIGYGLEMRRDTCWCAGHIPYHALLTIHPLLKSILFCQPDAWFPNAAVISLAYSLLLLSRDTERMRQWGLCSPTFTSTELNPYSRKTSRCFISLVLVVSCSTHVFCVAAEFSFGIRFFLLFVVVFLCFCKLVYISLTVVPLGISPPNLHVKIPDKNTYFSNYLSQKDW